MELLKKIDAIFEGDAKDAQENLDLLHLACVVTCLKKKFLDVYPNWRVSLLHVPSRVSLDLDISQECSWSEERLIQSHPGSEQSIRAWMEDVRLAYAKASEKQLVAYVPYTRKLEEGEEGILLVMMRKGLVEYMGNTLAWEPASVPGKLLRLVEISTCNWKLSEEMRLEVFRSHLTALRISLMVQERKIQDTCASCGTAAHCSWCSACKKAAYCGSSCQLAHYAIHKQTCSNACVIGTFDAYAYKQLCRLFFPNTPMARVCPQGTMNTLSKVTPSGSVVLCAAPTSLYKFITASIHKTLQVPSPDGMDLFDTPYKIQVPNSLASKFLDVHELKDQPFHFACSSLIAAALHEAMPIYEALVQQNPEVVVRGVKVGLSECGKVMVSIPSPTSQTPHVVVWACLFRNITVAEGMDCHAVNVVEFRILSNLEPHLKLTISPEQLEGIARKIQFQLRWALLEGRREGVCTDLNKQAAPVSCSLCGTMALPQFCSKCRWSAPICSTACFKANYQKHKRICSSPRPFMVFLPLGPV